MYSLIAKTKTDDGDIIAGAVYLEIGTGLISGTTRLWYFYVFINCSVSHPRTCLIGGGSDFFEFTGLDS